MDIMDCRRVELERTLDGLNTTGLPLLSKYQESYNFAGYADDIGIYYFVPKIAKAFGLSIDSAIYFFHCSLIAIGLTIGIVCFFLIFKSWFSRLFIVLGELLLAEFASPYQDVYIASHFAISAIIPLFILMTYRSSGLNLFMAFLLGCTGLVAGYCNLIRLHSGTGVLLFILLWTLLNKQLFKFEKAGCLFIVTIFALLPYLHFAHLEKNCREFLVDRQLSFQQLSDKHPIWHSIYLGLSYLNKKYVVTYNDDLIAYKVAKAVDPNVVYCSKEYDKILKGEVLKIAKEDPFFILKTIRAKTKALRREIWKHANFGLLFSFFVIPAFRQLIPFFAVICFYALPCILVMPDNRYMLGMNSIAILFAIYAIGLGLEKYSTISLNQKVQTI